MARNPDVNRLIAEDFKASGLGKREVARRVFGDEERYTDVTRWIEGKVTPGPSTAVPLAYALGQPERRYLLPTPLAAIASELAAANQTALSLAVRLQALETSVSEWFENALAALAALADGVEELARRLPPEADQQNRHR